MTYVVLNYHEDRLQEGLTMHCGGRSKIKLCFPRVLEALQTIKEQLGEGKPGAPLDKEEIRAKQWEVDAEAVKEDARKRNRQRLQGKPLRGCF